MPDTQRRQILNNVQTTLAAISIANGFRTDVKKAEQVLRHWDDVPNANRPWIGFIPRLETYVYQPGVIRVTLPITIMAYVKAGTNVTIKQTTTNDFMDDIIAALNADTARDCLAVSTSISDVVTDEGEQSGSGIIQISVDIVYYRTTGVT